MKPGEMRAQLRADRARLKREARALRATLHQRIEKQLHDPAFAPLLARRARARRQKILAAILGVLLLLLLLLIDCDPKPGAPVALAPVPAAVPTPEPVPPKKPVVKRTRRALSGTIEPTDRSAIEVEPPAAPSWLPDFRLQVAARSPRLAACFNGAEEPGAMRWTTVVHAESGAVSDSDLEPVFSGASVDSTQLECVRKVLSDPRYRLVEPDPDAVARRVSIIFEF